VKRLLNQQLIAWKRQSSRKPVLLDGARQTGKTYLIEQCFGKVEFDRVVKLDFLARPELAGIFSESLRPIDIIDRIELTLEITIDLNKTLLFFDEIGECQPAVNSLKFFAEQMPEIYLCASGSNISLLDSFPVGKVHLLELNPMCFEEFLMAQGNKRLLQEYTGLSRLEVVHKKLWKVLTDYYFVGGMPEAVFSWFNSPEQSLAQRCNAVKNIHASLLGGYIRDFGKYSGKVNALHIETVFKNIPLQLSKNTDHSVKRYKFSAVVSQKKRYQDLLGPIEWLEKTRLSSRCYPINCEPKIPLAAYRRENIFKLFFFDVGMLSFMLDLNYLDHQSQKFEFKGYIAENFVQNELRVAGHYPSYSWEQRNAEIEFIYKDRQSRVVPIEVKSGSRTKAQSMKSFTSRYSPQRTIKLIGAAGGTKSSRHLVLPLYYASKLDDFLQ